MSNDIKQESFEHMLVRFRNRATALKKQEEQLRKDPDIDVEETTQEFKYTLKHLFECNGREPTFVRPTWWTDGWFCVRGICTTGQKEAFGYTNNGVGIGYQSDQAVWKKVEVKEG